MPVGFTGFGVSPRMIPTTAGPFYPGYGPAGFGALAGHTYRGGVGDTYAKYVSDYPH